MNGREVELYVESATPGTYNRVAGQTGFERGATVGEIDASSKDSASEKILPGRRVNEWSYEGTYGNSQATTPDQGYLDLQAAFDAGTKVNVQLWEVDPADDTAKAILQGLTSVLDFSESFPDNDVATVSVRGKVDSWGPPS